jgi:hypothetical protein
LWHSASTNYATKSPGSDQILVEFIEAGGEILRSKIHKLITSIWHKEKLPDQWIHMTLRELASKDINGETYGYIFFKFFSLQKFRQ